MIKNYFFKQTFLSLSILFSSALIAQTTVFNYTGAMQTYVVPVGVTQISVDVIAAGGGLSMGSGGGTQAAGNGGRVQADLTVVPGTTLNIYVGGAGTNGVPPTPGVGGFNGGGNGGNGYSSYAGGGGGGASDIRNGGTALADRIVVAGGGGGGAYNYSSGDIGGAGGGLVGGDGLSNGSVTTGSGTGGTQSAGGNFGIWGGWTNATPGSLGVGGPAGVDGAGGGGGGGYYGGGGGAWSGGGGGSSYTDAVLATNVIHTQGYNVGDGQITITVLCAGLTTTVSATTVCEFDMITLDAVSSNGGTITWDNGVINNTPFQPATTGTITYTATSDDPSDCVFTVDIDVLEAPEFSLTTSDDFSGGNGGVYMTLISGSFPFTYDWDNDGTGDFDDSQNLTGLNEGMYTVVVQQGNGCTNTDSAYVNSQVGIESSEMPISIYPNPAVQNLTVEIPGSFLYNITDISGNLILTSNGSDKELINVENFAAGIYFIRIENDQKIQTIQFVKN